MTASLMIQGTTSDAGKSLIATGLCRILKRQGYHVAPFKPQNMALNSAVTIDNGEIGRAQAVQAQAAGIAPHTDMNPVLLKPNTDRSSQVIICGKAIGNMSALEYHAYKPTALKQVVTAYHRLSNTADTIIIEGAGSPAEINLRQNDIANMGFAEQIDCPVLLVADIDRGGVFAQLIGTLELLTKQERARVKGLIINKFRGDIKLLTSGIEWLEQRTGKPVLGVMPFIQGLHIEGEDSLSRSHSGAIAQTGSSASTRLSVIVPELPRLSNQSDFDALIQHPDIDFQFIQANQTPPAADLIILPGSKQVARDLDWLRQSGWPTIIQRHLRYGGKLIGICGGFQMLGQQIHDPDGIESTAGSHQQGLGLLDFETTLLTSKQLHNRQGLIKLNGQADAPIQGYEIHAGQSQGPALDQPALYFNNGDTDGAQSSDGQIFGSYLHGLFDDPQACLALLNWAGLSKISKTGLASNTTFDYIALREQHIERLADEMELHLDINAIQTLLRNSNSQHKAQTQSSNYKAEQTS